MRYVLLCAAAALLACGEDDPTPPPQPLVIPSTLNLDLVNGRVLPANVAQPGSPNTDELRAARLQFNANGTYTLSFDVRRAGQASATTLTETGSYTSERSGARIGTAASLVKGLGAPTHDGLSFNTDPDAYFGARTYRFRYP